MGKDWEHKFEDGILTLRFLEQYSLSELVDELALRIQQYAPNGEQLGVLFDATRSQSRRGFDEIYQSLPKFAQWKGQVVRFSVVVASDFHFGLTNQAGAFVEIEGIDVRPFRDTDQAVAWIREKLD